MSYDLFFRLRDGQPRPSPDRFRAWFESRPNWQWRDWGARYENEATGATFDANVRSADSPPTEASHPGVSVDMSGTAAHVTGLELRDEVAALVREFDLLVEDPQIDGNGRGELDPERLLAGWNAYNAFATKVAHTKSGQAIPPLMAAAKLEAACRWNRHRSDDEALFVPTIMFAMGDSEAETFVAWVGGEGALPVVDSIQTPLRRVRYADVAHVLGPPRDDPAPFHRVVGALATQLDEAIAEVGDVLPTPTLVPVGAIRTLEVVAPYRAIDPVARARAFSKRREAQEAEGEGRTEDALAARRAAAELVPDDAEIAVELAVALHRADRQREALGAAERAMALDPGNELPLVLAAVNGWKLGEYARALVATEKLLAINPDHENALLVRGFIFEHLARYDEALLLLDRALAKGPDPMIENSRAYLLAAAGRTAEARAGYEHALAALDAAIADSPSDGDLQGRRAYALLGLDRPGEALAAADPALELVSDPFLALQTKGRAELALGQPERAIEPLTDARSRREFAPLATYHLAVAYAALGDDEQASALFAQVSHLPHFARPSK